MYNTHHQKNEQEHCCFHNSEIDKMFLLWNLTEKKASLFWIFIPSFHHSLSLPHMYLLFNHNNIGSLWQKSDSRKKSISELQLRVFPGVEITTSLWSFSSEFQTALDRPLCKKSDRNVNIHDCDRGCFDRNVVVFAF